MAIGELEFVIKIREDLNRQLKALEGQIATGASGMGREFDRAGKAASGLTGFVREQRQENRLNNFLFREGTQVVGAFAIGLTSLNAIAGTASGNMKQMNNALNAGFTVFQGLNFALARANPVFATVTSLLGGLAAVWGQLGSSTSKEAMLAVSETTGKIVDAVNKADPQKLGFLSDYVKKLAELGAKREGVPEAVNKTAEAFDKLQKSAPDLAEGLARGLGGQKAVDNLNRSTAALVGSATTLEKIKSLREQLAEKGMSQGDIDLQVATNYGIILDVTQKTAEATVTWERAIDSAYLNGLVPVGDLSEKIRQNMERISVVGLGKVPETRPPQLDIPPEDSTTQLIGQLGTLGMTVDNVNSLIVGSTQSAAAAITDAMFGATQSIEQFFENMAKSIVSTVAQELLVRGIFAVLGTIFPGLTLAATVFGGKGTTTTGRIPVEESVGASRTININVNGEARTTTVKTKREVLAVVEEILELGK